ncbi:UNVERIFIED_CONTAM: hypothetical protein FKN15_024770 [Acipenser sinensis]
MGTQEEKDWVDAANDLLRKCHINLRMQNVSDCDASVFVSLYQAILGEGVPDYIAVPRSHEDDSHNVQAVIDSLALDYLQISLSHITGENIVRGNKESIKNLLDIFEGLLEYLTEEISETSSQSGDDPDPREKDPVVPIALWEDLEDQHKEALPAAKPSSSRGSSQSSLPSWDAEGSESTTELIRLGDSAHTFIIKQDKPTAPLPSTSFSSDPLNASATQLGHPIRQAIPLQPPYQPPQHRPDPWSIQPPGPGDKEPAPLLQTSSISAPKRVAFRTQPDVRLMSLQGGLEESRVWSSEEEGDPTDLLNRSSQRDHKAPQERTLINDSSLYDGGVTEPLSRRRVRNKLAEQELQEMSAKLSRRLEELDSMLKQALGETAGANEARGEEDKLSHHSDSFMECHRTKRQSEQEYKENLYKDAPRTPKRSRIPPAKPIPHTPRASQGTPARGVVRPSKAPPMKIKDNDLLPLLLEEFPCLHVSPHALNKMWKQQFRQIEQLTGSVSEQEQERSRAKLNTENDRVKIKDNDLLPLLLEEFPCLHVSPHALNKMWKQQFRQIEQLTGSVSEQEQERSRAKLNTEVEEAQRKYELLVEIIRKDQEHNQRLEFPCLHVSPHALNKMWKQQFRQIEQLTGSVSEQEQERSRAKLNTEVEEAQRKYELLVEIIRKEQEHNQRLKDFKDRIQQQKSAQSRMREQRQQVARAKKYYNDYHVQLRARMLRSRTREERIFKNLFEEGLEIQKKRVRELHSYAKDQREEHKKKHKEELESMENYYKDQFSMLAETLAQEQQEIQVRKKAQEKALQKMKKELRGKMEREIGELQEMIVQNDDDVYFRELEAERLSRRVHMASFQYSTSHLL